jgi:hypothetical protein
MRSLLGTLTLVLLLGGAACSGRGPTDPDITLTAPSVDIDTEEPRRPSVVKPDRPGEDS